MSDKFGTVLSLYLKNYLKRLLLIKYSFLIEKLCSFYKQSS